MPFASGAGLGPYEIVATLGAGGMREVDRGRDTRLDRAVAVKALTGGTYSFDVQPPLRIIVRPRFHHGLLAPSP